MSTFDVPGGIVPTIGGVLTALNEGVHISRSLRALTEQTFPLHELVLVDDGSTDITPAIMRGFVQMAPFKVTLLTNLNRGRANALNAGIGLLQTDLVMIVDADDISLPERSATHVAAFVSNPALAWHAGQLDYIDGSGRSYGFQSNFPTTTEGVADWLNRARMPVGHAASAFRNPRFSSEIPLYRNHANGAEDLDLLLRLDPRRVSNSQEVLVQYRSEAGDLTWDRWVRYRRSHSYVVTHWREVDPVSSQQWWARMSFIERLRALSVEKFFWGLLRRRLSRIRLRVRRGFR